MEKVAFWNYIVFIQKKIADFLHSKKKIRKNYFLCIITGVYIIKIIYIFAPFQKSYFSPKYSKNVFFSPFFPPLISYIRDFSY